MHTFDCTYKGASRHARHFYHEWCVGQPDDNTRRKFRTWANITSSLGHKSVDLLKMDIEGAEYSVLGELHISAAIRGIASGMKRCKRWGLTGVGKLEYPVTISSSECRHVQRGWGRVYMAWHGSIISCSVTSVIASIVVVLHLSQHQ